MGVFNAEIPPRHRLTALAAVRAADGSQPRVTRELLSFTSMNRPQGFWERRKVALDQKILPVHKNRQHLAVQREGRKGEREEKATLGLCR